jgi:hypothetical protein
MGKKKKTSRKALSQAELGQVAGGVGMDVAHVPMRDIEMTTLGDHEEPLHDNPPPGRMSSADGMEVAPHNKFMSSALALPHPPLSMERAESSQGRETRLPETIRVPFHELNRSLAETSSNLRTLHFEAMQNPTPERAKSFLDTARQSISSLSGKIGALLTMPDLPDSAGKALRSAAQTLKGWGESVEKGAGNALGWVKKNGPGLLDAMGQVLGAIALFAR